MTPDGVLEIVVPHGSGSERRGSVASPAGIVIWLGLERFDKSVSIKDRLLGESCRCPLHGGASKSSHWAEASGDFISFGIGLVQSMCVFA